MDEVGARSGRTRIGRSHATLAVVREEILGWLADRRQDPLFRRFTHHFEVLGAVLGRMLAAVAAELDQAAMLPSSGEVYERCRELDRDLIIVRRLHEWYAEKYDQRRHPRLGPPLRAADEIVRSCWLEPFQALRRPAPTGPLPYFDTDFDAYATPRTAVPVHLRGTVDGVVAEYVRLLPIPAIALPSWSVREAWWLVLAAHETGHHVQYDLDPSLVQATRGALAAATGGSRWAAHWPGWALEAFADAYSVLMVGPAALWAISELEHAPPEQMAALRPGGRYPPATTRLTLLGELSRQSQGMDRPPAGDVQAVARALLNLTVEGHRLQDLSGLRTAWFAPGGRVAVWAQRLAGRDPLLTGLGERPSARLLVSAGVAAARREGEHRAVLHDNLVALLPGCGPDGTMGTPPQPAGIEALAGGLAAQLIHEVEPFHEVGP